MENSVFRTSSVGEELKQHYVEARLHNDGPRGPVRDAILELQAEMTHSSANPIYILYDPVAKQPLGRRDGLLLESDFLEFLKSR